MATATAKTKDDLLDELRTLRAALVVTVEALEQAPDPRRIDGPPAYWDWYGIPKPGLRSKAITEARETLALVEG